MNTLQLDRCLADCIESLECTAGLNAMAAHASPRCVVWWGCLCGWSIWRPTPPPAEDPLLSIASQWVATGDDQLRRLAAQHSTQDQTSVCKWLLRAVVNSGGSLNFSDAPVEQQTPNFSGRLVKGFLQHLLATCAPIERTRESQNFLQLARQAITGPLPQKTA